MSSPGNIGRGLTTEMESGIPALAKFSTPIAAESTSSVTVTTTSAFHTTFLTSIRWYIKEEEEKVEYAPASNPWEKNEKETLAQIEMTGCRLLAGTNYAI